MKRLKRKKDYELTLEIRSDAFIRTPRPSQRSWLVNQALNECAQNLEALDALAERLVPGVDGPPQGTVDRTHRELADDEIMEDWQVPLMEAMADRLDARGGAVVEIGFGRGVAARCLQRRGVGSHTIVECNETLLPRFEAFRADHPGRDIRWVPGKWQDVLDGLGRFDGIFFHTYPLNESELVAQVGESTTFAEHFFPHAARHLVDGGRFTYLSNEIDSLGRSHQRLLLRHFGAVEISVVRDLPIPDDVRDAWWSDSMVVVKATR